MNKWATLRQWWKQHHPNKYWVTILVFLLLLCFFDENSLLRRIRYNRQLRELRRELREERKQRDEIVRKLNDLREGTRELEKIAREQYLMKKENEDIFLLEEK